MLDLGEVKSWLNKTDTARDDELRALTDRACAAVERELDWWFGAPRSVAETVNGNGRPVFYLRQPPHIDTPLLVEYRASLADDWEIVPATDYELDGRAVQHAYCWTRGLRNWRFTYAEGFDQPPGDVVQLVLRLIAAQWLRPQSGDIQSETLGRYSYTRGGEIDVASVDGWTAVAANWKRGRI